MEDLLLKDYDPKSCLNVKETHVNAPRFPVIDMHTHFGQLVMGADYARLYDTAQVVQTLTEAGVKKVVNLDGGYGDELARIQEKLAGFEDFFIQYGTVDVSRFEEPGFEHMVYHTLQKSAANGIRGLKLWKPVGLGYRERNGKYLRPDDERLQCIWQTAAELGLPVLFHIADPVAFFLPPDRFNERYEELCTHPDWSFSGPELYRFDELMEMQKNLLEQNSATTFVIAHVGSYAENLCQVGRWLERFPNMYVDIAARIAELGRQPYTARDFIRKYADRVLFGTDFIASGSSIHRTYYRFLETCNEYFSPEGENAPPVQGRWNIYGLNLPQDVLRKVYYKNAERVLGI